MAERSQFVTLGAADELFAAPVERVQEIFEMRPIARLPRAPHTLLGVIDVRGRGVPVVDLRRLLGLDPNADDENTRIIVLFAGAGAAATTIGLRADRVYEVTVFDDEVLEKAPDVAIGWRDTMIAGIGRRNGAFVTVLDLDRLFDGNELHTLAADRPGRLAVA